MYPCRLCINSSTRQNSAILYVYCLYTCSTQLFNCTLMLINCLMQFWEIRNSANSFLKSIMEMHQQWWMKLFMSSSMAHIQTIRMLSLLFMRMHAWWSLWWYSGLCLTFAKDWCNCSHLRLSLFTWARSQSTIERATCNFRNILAWRTWWKNNIKS